MIELLVTMGIIAVLTGMAVFNFNQSRVRARDVQRKSDLGQLQKAFELYKNDNKSLYYTPTSNPDTDEFQTELLEGSYIKENFTDPKGSDWSKYQYYSDDDGRTYYLMACLENKADTTRTTVAATCNMFGTTACTCGASSAGVMYIITNP